LQEELRPDKFCNDDFGLVSFSWFLHGKEGRRLGRGKSLGNSKGGGEGGGGRGRGKGRGGGGGGVTDQTFNPKKKNK
jgi:hypothetical protein